MKICPIAQKLPNKNSPKIAKDLQKLPNWPNLVKPNFHFDNLNKNPNG